jgi:hypothetical protein
MRAAAQAGVADDAAGSVRFDWRIEGENLDAPILLSGRKPSAELSQGTYYVTLTVNDGREITTSSQARQSAFAVE